MNPFIYFFPTVNWHFPFSGNVMQDIKSSFDQFFNSIPPEVGNSKIEKEVFTEIASYGDQLGTIIDVLYELIHVEQQPTEQDIQNRKNILAKLVLLKIEIDKKKQKTIK